MRRHHLMVMQHRRRELQLLLLLLLLLLHRLRCRRLHWCLPPRQIRLLRLIVDLRLARVIGERSGGEKLLELLRLLCLLLHGVEKHRLHGGITSGRHCLEVGER